MYINKKFLIFLSNIKILKNLRFHQFWRVKWLKNYHFLKLYCIEIDKFKNQISSSLTYFSSHVFFFRSQWFSELNGLDLFTAFIIESTWVDNIHLPLTQWGASNGGDTHCWQMRQVWQCSCGGLCGFDRLHFFRMVLIEESSWSEELYPWYIKLKVDVDEISDHSFLW